MPGQKVSNYSVGAWVFPEILQNSAFHFPQVMLGAISKIRSRFKYEFHDYIISMHQTFLLLGGCSLQLAASVVSFNCREPRSETHSLNPPSMIAIPIRKSAEKRCSLYIQPADIGWPTGNGKKLSKSQACCLSQLCLGAA